MKLALRIKELGLEAKEGVPLARHTTFRVGGPADFLFAPRDLWELKKTLAFLTEEGLPYFFLGGGSNLLVRDGGFRGAAVSLKNLSRIEVEDELVRAEAGVNLPYLLGFCAEKGLSGLEFLAGVPATVGGAVAMNAGAFGQEIKDLVREVSLYHEGKFFALERERLSFAYRRLELPEGALVVAATFSLKKTTPSLVRQKMAEYLSLRRRKQPLSFPSAGCVFKNPGELPAGFLIEAVGLKGFRLGGAEISRKHANFILNRGQASASDILALMELAKERVFREYGLELEEEIKIVGEA